VAYRALHRHQVRIPHVTSARNPLGLAHLQSYMRLRLTRMRPSVRSFPIDTQARHGPRPVRLAFSLWFASTYAVVHSSCRAHSLRGRPVLSLYNRFSSLFYA
jgi:hypothetical protein